MMSVTNDTITITPIGRVRGTDDSDKMEIEVFPDYAEGLYRIEESRSIIVVFHFHRSERIRLKVHPKGNVRNPLVGVFASRSPDRPNHIGITTVRLLKVENNVLTVEGLDAWEGTPVLDIKPVRRRDEMRMDTVTGKTN